MTKKRINIHTLLVNRVFLTFVCFLFVIVLAMGIYKYRIVHSQFYSYLQGTYKIELDSSYVCRSFDIYPGFIVQIHNDNIHLPTFKRKNSNTRFTSRDLAILKKVNNGTWTRISSNPDSIFINAEGHVLYGKYQVTFKTYESGSLGYTMTDFMYLDNDSTHLCLTKIK